MEGAAAVREHAQPARESTLSPAKALLLAAWFGLVGGYFDLAVIFLKRDVFHLALYYEQGRFFRWVVPLADLLIMLAPGLMVASVSYFRPSLLSSRRAVWIFATLAIWGPLLRLPLYGAATLLLAAGAGHAMSGWVARRLLGSRWLAPLSVAALAIGVAVTAVTSLGRYARAESQALASLSPAPSGAGNVLLIVMDTVSRREPWALRPQSRHDATPEPMGRERRSIRLGIFACPLDFSIALLVHDRPVALDVECTLAADP